jgi:hypothetical protein
MTVVEQGLLSPPKWLVENTQKTKTKYKDKVCRLCLCIYYLLLVFAYCHYLCIGLYLYGSLALSM